ncbi:VOC family protein [Hyphococcus sp.]|uniref:VOC family protein n=1 Tax=Hyphococcus sp. TaxID=2038636 RepID=UPI003CCBE4D9
MRLALVTLVIGDYDEAIAYYCDVLGFTLKDNSTVTPEKRWVVVSPGEDGADLLLAKAASNEQRAAIGNQTGGRVAMFLNTANFDETYQRLKQAGVEFIEAPRDEPYGRVVVFRDLYGNKWDLIQPV